MNTLVFSLAFVATASARPQSYSAPGSTSFGGFGGGSVSHGGGGSVSHGGGGSVSHGGGGGGQITFGFGDGCGGGQVRAHDGGCVTPEVTRNLFLYAAPAAPAVAALPPGNIPNPKVHLNYVFVRTDNSHGGVRPVVVPPPKQKTLVYVLNKRPDPQQTDIIEVPATPTQPEVFFVNYKDGDTAQLPGGVSLSEALSQSIQQGQHIQAQGGHGGSNGGSFVDGGSSFVDDGSLGVISGGGYGR